MSSTNKRIEIDVIEIVSLYKRNSNIDNDELKNIFNCADNKQKLLDFFSFENKLFNFKLQYNGRKKDNVFFINKLDEQFGFGSAQGVTKNNDEGWIDAVILGKENGNGFLFWDNYNKKFIDISPNELAAKLEKMELGDIRLLSCHAGAGNGEALRATYKKGRVKYPETIEIVNVSIYGDITSGSNNGAIIWNEGD